MEKKVVIVLGSIGAVLTILLITRGAAWPYLILGTLAYVIYKNNRFI